MRRWLLGSLLVLSVGCGTDDPLSSDPFMREGKPDAGVAADARTPRRDSSSEPAPTGDKPTTPGGGGIEGPSCGEVRGEAERLPSAANIVWVIDASGSMNEEAALVKANLQKFVDSLKSLGLADYRVVIVSQRRFIDAPEPLRSDAEHFLYVDRNVGSNDPLAHLLEDFSAYQPFLLPGVLTHFVVVTDDESRPLSGKDFVAQMDAKLDGDFRVHAVASPPESDNGQPMSNDPLDWLSMIGNRGCKGANGNASAPGIQNYQAAALTGGLTFSICEPDWSGLFTELASRVSEAALPCSFQIPPVTDGTTFDPEQVSVVYTATGGKGVSLKRATSKDACGDGTGWYYDDPEDPKTVQLCPASCEASDKGGAIDIEFGCVYRVQ